VTIDSGGPTTGDVAPRPPLDAWFEAQYCNANPRLLKYLLFRGVARADIDDVAMEAWLAGWVKAHTSEPPRNLVAYVYGAAMNLCRKRWAHSLRWKCEVLLPDNEEASVPDPTDAVDDYLRLKQVLEVIDLPERQLLTYVLREYCGFSYEQVAEAMGVTTDTVGKQLVRARRAIADFRKREEDA
jgi:RNA polymerase sigma-70 factor (ECF subfamily)